MTAIAECLHVTTRYPHIVEDVIEEEEQVVNGVTIPIDTSQPNPNQTEFDNLYLVCSLHNVMLMSVQCQTQMADHQAVHVLYRT